MQGKHDWRRAFGGDGGGTREILVSLCRLSGVQPHRLADRLGKKPHEGGKLQQGRRNRRDEEGLVLGGYRNRLYIGYSFAQMGETIGVGLGFMQFIGWFVLANYLVNEIRSILENMVEMGVNVPPMLIKGLKIASELIDAAASIGGEDDGK